MAGDGNTDDVFDALSHRVRRYVLAALAGSDSPLAIADLAADVAVLEQDAERGEPPTEAVARIRRQIHHTHGPKLDDLGFVEYDREDRVVTLTEQGEAALSSIPEQSDETTDGPD